jgi:ubiquinone/menaquinone biosynthesis C-methylase UbiE
MDTLQQENIVSEAFSRQSASFDDIYEHNPITLWMRDKARAEALEYLQSGDNMLELNCGTGIDTLFFAKKGHEILATDNSEGMLNKLKKKIAGSGLEDNVRIQHCSFNNLAQLIGEQFSYIFSNFSGLNCTSDLAKVLSEVDTILKPGGHFTFVIMPRVCPWEMIMLLRGRVKLALRRFKRAGAKAHIEGVLFDCYYYNASYVKKHVPKGYSLRSLKGLASLVPPPSLEYFPSKYPRLFSRLQKLEDAVCDKFPFNSWCDQYVITMRKPI